MLRAILLIALALGLLAAASACATRSGSGDSAAAVPKRIVSLSPALTEILFAVGAGDRVVGVTQYCDFPEAAKSIPKVGGYVNPSVEAVLALKPDLLVVSPGPGNRDAVLAIQRSGVRTELFPSETLEESLAAIQAVAGVAGVASAGRELAAKVRARLDAVAVRAAKAPRVRTFFCIQIDPIIAAGKDTLPSQLLELAGGENVVSARRYPRMDVEAVAAARPELILQARMDVANRDGRIEDAFWSRWPAIPAVARGRVVVLQDDLALRPGPRVAEAAEELERILRADGAAARAR